MSFDTHKTWLYRLAGRNLDLYQLVDGAVTDVLGDYLIRLPRSYYGVQLIYPSEAITNGLRYEGTAFLEPFVDVDPNALSGNDNPTLASEAPEEGSHVNVSIMLSLAVVDYLKAMRADGKGDLDRKEYYMKEFWKKVGDNESNKRIISMSFPMSPYAVR